MNCERYQTSDLDRLLRPPVSHTASPEHGCYSPRMSCRACEALTIDGLFDRTYTAPGHMILHSSYNLLEAAAKNGCNTCRAFDSRFRNNFVDLKARLALLEARGAVPPVVVFVGMGVPQNDQRPLIQLHVQIGDVPERPGVEQLKISFRVSKSRGMISSSDLPNGRANMRCRFQART